jgi:hypothetical protein
MRHVGWYCEHEYIRDDAGNIDWKNGPYTPHRFKFWKQRPKWKHDRGWDETTNTSKALDFHYGYEESNCPYRVPMFIEDK